MSAILTLSILNFGTSVKAQDVFCNNLLVNGSYGLQITGYLLPGDVPYASLGLRQFFKGNYSGDNTNNINGTYASATVKGTYQVYPDCKIYINYTITNADGSTQNASQTGIIVNDGKEILIIQTSPSNDNIESGVYKRSPG